MYLTQNNSIPQHAVSSIVLNVPFKEKRNAIAKDISSNNFTGNLTNYSAAQYALGAGNYWKDKNGNAIVQY